MATELLFELTRLSEAAPVDACRLAGGPVKFAATNAEGNTPIEMLARSPDPIDHWYWGRIVHDMAGMKMHKPVLTCDYEHYDPIGFLDKFNAGDSGLRVAGELVPTDVAGDVTTRILQLARGGVPFEASMYFDETDLVLEYVPEGYQTSVNGTTFEGPGVVAREWWIRGVAVCSYGYDKNTQSKFTRESGRLRYRPTSTTTPEANMPTKITSKLSETATPTAEADQTTRPAADPPAKPEAGGEQTVEKPAETATETAAAPVAPEGGATPAAELKSNALASFRAEVKRFRTAFGDKGPVYFDDGLTFEEAAARQVKELGELSAKQAEQIKDLSQKLSQATGQPEGELTAVGFDATGDPEKSKSKFAGRISVARLARRKAADAE